jgi:hypothetical protein
MEQEMPLHNRPNAKRSSFSSVRAPHDAFIRHHLRSRYTLWLHGWVMGLLTLGVMWGCTAGLRYAGVDSLALRYALSLGAGWLCYLLLLRIWASALLRRENPLDAAPDPGLPDIGNGHRSDGGPGDAGGPDLTADAGDASSALGDAASGALDAAGAADEAAIVIIPVLAVFALVLAVALGAGWLLLAYFGTDALLAVAVELAFAWTAARTATRVERQGWLPAAIRLTWKPLLGALTSAVLLGALIDHFVPQADTLPAAVKLLRGR